MPTYLTVNGIRFYFFSNDHSPIHVHIEMAECKAKFHIENEIELVESHGFSPSDLKKLRNHIAKYRCFMIDKWKEHFDE